MSHDGCGFDVALTILTTANFSMLYLTWHVSRIKRSAMQIIHETEIEAYRLAVEIERARAARCGGGS